jgi:hypothetical protein
MRKGKRIFFKFIALILLNFSNPSYADTADLQIDWILPINSYAIDGKSHKKNSARISSTAVPRKLFVTKSDVYSDSGLKILEAGAQLYMMASSNLMICSQVPSPKPYIGSSNRICFVDEDGDGILDTYFTRSLGRSFLSTDEMWFAMNANIPAERNAVKHFEIAEVDRSLSIMKIDIGFYFHVFSEKNISVQLSIEKKFKFDTDCDPRQFDGNFHASNGSCLLPDFFVRAPNPNGGTSELLDIRPPSREASVRFDVDPRLFGSRLMKSAYFE